jgi:nitrogen regulatory protein PII 2
MKKILAIIRMNKVNVTKQALIEAGFPAFTVRKAQGRGRGNVDFRVIRGAEVGAPEALARLKDDGPMLIPKRLMTVVVEDTAVPKVVETIIQSNKTGQTGDGKIFVLPLSDVIRIRTGEKGAAAVN